jgi:hypothetical protein
MKKLVIIPGGFHPLHAGHKALYDAAREAFPSADIYMAATADTSTRPFPFDVKKKLARIAGISGHRFIQVKSPFRAQEITQMYDPNETQLIFVRSEKDRDQQPQAGGVKRDGTASYLQPYRRNGLEPMSKHGYMAYLPTVQFGPGMTSATEIRAKWPGMDAEQKINLVRQLYPDTNQKPALADVIVKIFDEVIGAAVDETLMGAPIGTGASTLQPQGMDMPNGPDSNKKGMRLGIEFEEVNPTATTLKPAGTYRPLNLEGYNTSFLQKIVISNRPLSGITPDQALAELSSRVGSTEDAPSPEFTSQYLQPGVKEATVINDPDAGLQIQPAGGMGTWDETSLVNNLARKFASMLEMVKGRNYKSLYYVLYRAGVVENMVRALAELEAFQERQGRRPIARGREIDTTDYIEEKNQL